MSTLRPPDEPGVDRALRRASPLLGNEDDRDGAAARWPPPKSLRRTIQGFKDRSMALGRSRSLSTHKTPLSDSDDTSPAPHKGHSRSLTDVSAVYPMLAAVQTPPPVTSKRLSAQPRAPALSVVSEGLPAHHVSSNIPNPEPPSPVLNDVKTLQTLHRGTFLTKVTAKKSKVCLFRLEPDLGQIVWVSKKHKIIPIETIKEIRSGKDTRYNREQLHLAKEYEDRWLTVIYILDGNYKTLNLIAPDRQTFQMWDRTLRDLYNIRKELMRGLGNWEMRQAIWEKQYWKAADEEPDHKLSFSEIESLCRKLNINSSREDLSRLFKQADTRNRNYLDFDDFRRFVKLLKARPEINRMYKKLRARSNGIFDFVVFEKFMREEQKSTLSRDELQALFDKFATPAPPLELLGNDQIETNTAQPSPASIMTYEGFASFLLSPDNSAFVDQYRDVSQPMTRPLSEYFISSSHNTYLVGHQLVGTSSVEGYIRALLHGCRSVEVDIYDGESEPMIFHGKTLTTKVSLREVCKAIMKYGFSTSPYPIIISAEVHCSVPQQERIAAIMIEEFGDSLVRVPVEGLAKIEVLPSPEDLKGKILLKAKNQDLSKTDSAEGDPFMSEMSSASDSDLFFDIPRAASVDAVITRQLEPTIQSAGPIPKAKTTILERVKSASSRATGIPKADTLSQSPPTMTPLEVAQAPSRQAADKTAPLPSPPGFFQRARRSLKGSSSSASDAPSLVSETSSSSADARTSSPPPPPPPIPSPKPLTLLQRLRTNKAATTPVIPPPPIIVPSQSVVVPRRIQSAKIYPAPTPETVLAGSPAPTSAAASVFAVPPRSAALKTGAISISGRRPSDVEGGRPKLKMSPHLLALLVYTVGVKCRGINKKEEYAPEHMFSLSEKMANKMLKFGMWDLIKHTKTHMVRTYPKGMRVSSTNYEPHRFWAAGAQLVALNWQTFDLGYMINYAMFQRNGRSGYVLKPDAIRLAQKDLLSKRISYTLEVKVISGQQLPRPKDTFGHEIGDKPIVDPYVEVTLYVPDWPVVSESKKDKDKNKTHKDDQGVENGHPTTTSAAMASTPGYSVSKRTSTVKKNGFNPVWEDELSLPFDCVGDMMDLVFVRFMVRQEVKDSDEPLAVYCAPLGSLQQGYRHLPLHDSQMSQYLFSTLFVRINVNRLSIPST